MTSEAIDYPKLVSLMRIAAERNNGLGALLRQAMATGGEWDKAKSDPAFLIELVLACVKRQTEFAEQKDSIRRKRGGGLLQTRVDSMSCSRP